MTSTSFVPILLPILFLILLTILFFRAKKKGMKTDFDWGILFGIFLFLGFALLFAAID